MQSIKMQRQPLQQRNSRIARVFEPLSCSHTSKGITLRLQRRLATRSRRKSTSSNQLSGASSTAMTAVTQQTIEVLEGSQLEERPDSTDKTFLYTHMLCPYAQTALLTLLCKGVPHQVVNVDLSQKPTWFTKLCTSSGFSATVPVIDYRGKAQTESIDICRWACSTFQGPEYRDLKYTHPQERKQVDALIRQRTGFKEAGMDLLAGQTARQWAIGTNQSQGQWKAFHDHLMTFQAVMDKSGGPYLLGKEVSLADLLYLPFMERFALALPTLTSSNLVDACNGVMLPWLEAMGKLECCQQACPDHKLFQQALRDERSLDFFDFKTYTAYQLHPHLQ